MPPGLFLLTGPQVSGEPLPALSRAPHTAWRELDGETVIADLKEKWMYGLSATAGVVWHALDGRRDLQEIHELVSGLGFRGEIADIADLLAELESLCLVERSPSDPPADPARNLRVAPLPGTLAEAKISWREDIRAFGMAGSCAFLPGQNPLCNQTPMS